MWMWGQWGQWGQGGKFREGERDVADAAWKTDVSGQLKDLVAKVMEMALVVQALNSSIMTRKEIEDADNRRVSVDQYTSDQRAMSERMVRLEGSAGRILPWVALIISTILGFVGIAISVISLAHTLR